MDSVWSGVLIAVMLVAIVSLAYGLIRAATTRPGDANWWGPRWALIAAAGGIVAVGVAAFFVASL